MWEIADIKQGKKYKLWLCQGLDRRRFITIAELGCSNVPEGGIFESTEVPIVLLIERNLQQIAAMIPLQNGDRFFIEAHGIWLTSGELEALEDDLDIPWATAEPPIFPPR